MRMRCWAAVMGMIVGGVCTAQVVPSVSEDFGDPLGEGWTWLRERPEDWRVVDGGLEIRSRPGDADSVTTAVLRSAPPLDGRKVSFEVTVAFLSEPTVQFEQAGLVWYNGGKPVFKLVHELVDGERMIIPGRALTQSRSVTLRLVVEHGQYLAQYREREGKAFETVAEGDLDTVGDNQISLQTYHGPAEEEHWVRFTGFRIIEEDA